MLTIHAGTDAYGRVKTVAGTPVVTKFAMFHFVPVYPLRSYYQLGAGRASTWGFPFLARIQTVSLHGYPLAAVDKTSVLIAYVRGLFGVLTVLGAMSLVPLIMYIMGEQLDELGKLMTRGLLTSLATGIVGGTLTYVVPLTPRRERDVRRYCGELLGAAVDPARVTPQLSEALADYAAERLEEVENSWEEGICRLIQIRAELAGAPSETDDLETKTDRLLEELNHVERNRI